MTTTFGIRDARLGALAHIAPRRHDAPPRAVREARAARAKRERERAIPVTTPEGALDDVTRRILVGVDNARPRFNEKVKSVHETNDALVICFDASFGGDQTKWHIRVVSFSRMTTGDDIRLWKYTTTRVVPTPDIFVSRRGGSASITSNCK